MPSSFPSSLQSTNSLSKLKSFDLTPSIGTEFDSSTQLSSLLTQPGAVKDLAILVSQRGVLFFRGQVLSPKDQLELVNVLGEETGRPKEAGLHIHPTTEATSELGDEVRKITPGALDLFVLHSVFLPRSTSIPWSIADILRLASQTWTRSDTTDLNVLEPRKHG